MMDSFVQHLPATYRSVKDDEDPVTGMEPAKKKRKSNKTQDDSGKERVENTKKIDSWLASDQKNYRETFAGKHLGARPKLFGRPLCNRFHSKGYCFSNCINKVTHIPSKELDDTTKESYVQYCTLCRE